MEKSSAIYIGKLLRKNRIKKGLTQLDVAKKFKYSTTQFIHLIETGKSKVPLKILAKYCDFLGVDKTEIKEVLFRDFVNKIKKELS